MQQTLAMTLHKPKLADPRQKLAVPTGPNVPAQDLQSTQDLQTQQPSAEQESSFVEPTEVRVGACVRAYDVVT